MRRPLLLLVAIASVPGMARADGPVPLIPEIQPPLPAPPAPIAPTAPTAPPPKSANVKVAAATTAAGDTDWMATLGSLERLSVTRVLAAHGYVLEPNPTNRVIGEVHIVNEDVFAEKNFLQFFNLFHYTTRASAIAKELVISAGEVWDQERVDETARRLRDPLYTSVVAIVPVKATDPAKVDMLVVTRDVWSLRLNTKYAFFVDKNTKKLTNLTVSLSENNFLGTRAVVALGMAMDQGEVSTGPIFVDKNLFGEHISLSARADVIYNRDALLDHSHLAREGSDSSIALSRPLWSLGTNWAWGVNFSHTYAISRSFVGTNLKTFNDPETPQDDALPYIYQYKNIDASASVTRQWGSNHLKQQLAVGWETFSGRSSPYQFVGDDAQKQAFIDGVLPRTEVASGPYIAYSGFQAKYKTLHNISTYDLGEDARFGPDYNVTLAVGSKLAGGDFNYLRGTVSAGITVPWCGDGFVRPSGTISMRRQPGLDPHGNDFIDNTASGTLRVATPTWRHARLVWQTTLATRWHETQNRYYTIGQDSGLRGFVIDEFAGQNVLSSQVEMRTAPLPIWVFRLGGVAFYEVGGAADKLATMPLHQDVGFGLRGLIPQTSREVYRFDFAFPLDGAQAGALRFIAGFESAF